MTETLTAPVDAADGSANGRKPLLLLGGLAAVLLLGGGGYLLLGGGGSADTQVLPPVVHHARAAAAAAPQAVAKAPSAKKAALLPKATSVPLGRDPFLALYVQPANATGAAATTAAGTTSPTGTSTTGTSTGTATTATGTSTGTGTTTLATAPYALKLVSVSKVTGSGRTYTFSYDGLTKGVLEGQRFGKYGEVTVLGVTYRGTTPTGAIIQVGDDEPFTLAIGEKVSVK